MRSKTLFLVGLSASLAVAAVVVFYVLAFSPQQEIALQMYEFGFNGNRGGPTLRMKAGETVWISLENRGGVLHEFMVVRDRDGFIAELKRVAAETYTQVGTVEELEKSSRVENVHHRYAAAIIIHDGSMAHHVEVSPGGAARFQLRINDPGTYYYICPKLVATYPETHADEGMGALIVVEP